MEESNSRIAVDYACKAHLEKAAKWAKFIAIVNFIGIGLGLLSMIIMLLGMIVAGASFSEMAGMPGSTALPSGFMIIYSIAMIPVMVVAIFIALHLSRFATKTLSAVRQSNDAAMTEALASLGRYFKLSGILIIIGFAIMILAILFMVIFAASMAAGI